MTQPLQWCSGWCDWNCCPRSRPPPSSGGVGAAMGPRANKHQVYIQQINTGWSSPGPVNMQTHCTSKSASPSQLYIYTRVASANSRHAAVAVETCSHSEGIWREAGCSLAPLTSLTNWLLYVSGSVRRTGRRWGRRQKNRLIISFAHPGGGSFTYIHTHTHGHTHVQLHLWHQQHAKNKTYNCDGRLSWGQMKDRGRKREGLGGWKVAGGSKVVNGD